MTLPDEVKIDYIEDVVKYRFENSIRTVDVLRWLSNFDDEDQKEVLKVFSQIRYFSYEECLNLLSNSINDIRRNTGEKRILFLSIGEAGKSGDAMLYYVQQLKVPNSKRYNSLDELIKDSEEDDIICMLDDFLGSGQTVADWLDFYFKTHSDSEAFLEAITQGRVFIIAVALMEKAIRKLTSLYPNLQMYGEMILPVFKRDRSPFGSRVKMVETRETCYKYGLKVAKGKKNILGYDNCQALIVFDHGTPNNTLPIIWANKTHDGKEWIPLFPRFAKDKIKRTKEKGGDRYHSLSLARELFGFTEVVQSLFSNTNISLFEMVKMRANRWNDLRIAYALELTSSEMQNLWEEGMKLNLWDSEHNLTNDCLNRYRELQKMMNLKSMEKKEHPKIADADDIYIPETFKGLK